MKKEESAHFGQKIRTEGPPDRSSAKVNMDEALMGKSMKGGPTDTTHSTTPGYYNDKGRKSRS